MIEKVMELIFPPKCIFCSNVLVYHSDIYICRSCMDLIPFREIGNESYKNIFNTPYCDIVVCPCRYEGNIKKGLMNFKFKNKPSFYRALGFIMLSALDKFLDRNKIDIVVAVPLSRKRFKFRGYNQAELLAKYISKELQVVNASSIIIRTIDTIKQTALDKQHRELNVVNVFNVIDKDFIKNKNILIVDDIFTTGSTINECAKAFRNAGASKVFAVVVASGRVF